MQVVELPYAGSDISMVLALPKDGSTIADVVDAMDDEHYKTLLGSMTQTEADLYLPKFTIESPVYRLKNDLIALGMPTAFSPNADFSGMNGVGELFIDDVLHKAYIEVNEEGTEAAAATAVIMKLTSTGNDTTPSRVVFDADHPFVFLIQHNPTGTILFLGTVTDPSL
jgi:serpin B